jgi:hypothetical protein
VLQPSNPPLHAPLVAHFQKFVCYLFDGGLIDKAECLLVRRISKKNFAQVFHIKNFTSKAPVPGLEPGKATFNGRYFLTG